MDTYMKTKLPNKYENDKTNKTHILNKCKQNETT